MKNKVNFFVKLSIWFITNIHQKRISPQLNKRGAICRFYPSCSNYSITALKKYGFVRGWYLAIKRISRCRIDNYESCVDFPWIFRLRPWHLKQKTTFLDGWACEGIVKFADIYWGWDGRRKWSLFLNLRQLLLQLLQPLEQYRVPELHRLLKLHHPAFTRLHPLHPNFHAKLTIRVKTPDRNI